MKNNILVLGLGNELMADDGIGVSVIKEMQKSECNYSDVTLLEGATLGIALLEELKNHQKIIVVDAVQCALKPGSIVKFGYSDISNYYHEANYSVHHLDFITSVELAQLLLDTLPEIIIIGIQPREVKIKMGLSKEVQEKIPRLIELVNEEILSKTKVALG